MRTGMYLLPAAALFCAIPAAAAQPRFYYYQPSGTVGRHLASILTYHPEDWPGCKPIINGIELEGDLPPGLTLSPFVPLGHDEGIIQGTPSQAGDWRFTVVVESVECGGQNFGDMRVPVTFHIEDDYGDWY